MIDIKPILIKRHIEGGHNPFVHICIKHRLFLFVTNNKMKSYFEFKSIQYTVDLKTLDFIINNY